jgi:hypothetical protein
MALLPAFARSHAALWHPATPFRIADRLFCLDGGGVDRQRAGVDLSARRDTGQVTTAGYTGGGGLRTVIQYAIRFGDEAF